MLVFSIEFRRCKRHWRQIFHQRNCVDSDTDDKKAKVANLRKFLKNSKARKCYNYVWGETDSWEKIEAENLAAQSLSIGSTRIDKKKNNNNLKNLRLPFLGKFRNRLKLDSEATVD